MRQFWTDTIQPLAPGGAYSIGACTGQPNPTGTTSPVVAAFDLFCSVSLNESLALYNLDTYGIQDFNNPNRVYFPSTGQYTYYSPHYSSLFAWRSLANANYHAMQEGNATLVAAPVTGKYTVQSGPDAGAINIFKGGPDAINDFTYTLPGQSGGRNQIRGQGYFGIDIGLAKRWLMPWSEKQRLQFRWEVFNLTNSVRFDVQSSLLSSALTLGSSTSFGNYSGLLTNPRIMQFALRYDF